MKTNDVCVLGGGVTGITTAIVLEAIGFHPTIVTRERPLVDSGIAPMPTVPSSYAMATAYPHNLLVENLEKISANSQAAFQTIHNSSKYPVEIHHLFEVFEEEPDPAALGTRRMNFRTFDGTAAQLKKSVNPPIRDGANYLWGWSFDTFFADMPAYLEYLWNRYRHCGGTHSLATVNPENLEEFSGGRPLVNCLGWGSVAAFADETEAQIVRGRQVMVYGASPPLSSKGVPLAYNYTPTADIFARADGKPEYVHFFARADGWILGQTREPGRLDRYGNWSGEAVADGISISGQSVPEQILSLNSSILKSWLDVEIAAHKLEVRAGYRYYRDPKGTGVKLESERRHNMFLVHNYGHGGSGVTMSWGCAIKSAQLLIDEVGMPNRRRTNLDDFDRKLIQLVCES